jgi:hypothetical protein
MLVSQLLQSNTRAHPGVSYAHPIAPQAITGPTKAVLSDLSASLGVEEASQKLLCVPGRIAEATSCVDHTVCYTFSSSLCNSVIAVSR